MDNSEHIPSADELKKMVYDDLEELVYTPGSGGSDPKAIESSVLEIMYEAAPSIARALVDFACGKTSMPPHRAAACKFVIEYTHPSLSTNAPSDPTNGMLADLKERSMKLIQGGKPSEGED